MKKITANNKSKLERRDKKVQEFRDRMQSYNYLRQNRVSYWQTIYTAIIIASIILSLDFIFKYILVIGNKMNVWIIKLMILGLILLIFGKLYKWSLKQTQKPIFVAENMICTVEKGPYNVKDKDGKEYSIFSIRDDIPYKKGDGE